MGSFPSAQHWRDPTWNAMSRFGLPQTDKTTWSACWKESSGRPGGQGEAGEHKMKGEAERTEIVQSRAEKSSSCSIPLSKQDRIEDELSGMCRESRRANGCTVQTWDIPVHLFCDVRALGEIAQRTSILLSFQMWLSEARCTLNQLWSFPCFEWGVGVDELQRSLPTNISNDSVLPLKQSWSSLVLFSSWLL